MITFDTRSKTALVIVIGPRVFFFFSLSTLVRKLELVDYNDDCRNVLNLLKTCKDFDIFFTILQWLSRNMSKENAKTSYGEWGCQAPHSNSDSWYVYSPQLLKFDLVV